MNEKKQSGAALAQPIAAGNVNNATKSISKQSARKKVLERK